jgi:hypothetical protein
MYAHAGHTHRINAIPANVELNEINKHTTQAT